MIKREVTIRRIQRERGMSLVELMVAAAVLLVGIAGVGILFGSAAASGGRNKTDTGATMVAKMVLEQITAQNPNSTAPITITDCAGTPWTVTTTPAAAPNGAGSPPDSTQGSVTYGGIDWTATAPTGYSMRYKGCESGGRSTTFDVRWNVMTLSPNATRFITVSARQVNVASSQLGGAQFALPVTLRAIGAQ